MYSRMEEEKFLQFGRYWKRLLVEVKVMMCIYLIRM